MIHPELMVSNQLLEEFQACIKLQYSGKLDVKTLKGNKWSFYYRLGRIVWATGGNHPFRRWRRLMALHCPEIEVDRIQLRHQDIKIDYWDYRLLEILHERQKIKREQVHTIVENTIAELLFDLAQHISVNSVTFERIQDNALDAPMSFTRADISLKLMQEGWKNWVSTGLTNYSPDFAPVLRKPEQLQQMVSPAVYKNFVTLINGKYTLRDLAVKMKQNVLPVARSLLPYILKGIIELVEVPDLPLRIIDIQKKQNPPEAKGSNSPLIACVDDSPQVGQMLEQIFAAHGIRFIKIQDAVQALPVLLEHKPDLIFLDLVMPVASGYEICAQLRRISVFANTPVIILTGSDGLFDRVRAKVVGSNDYVTKPVTAEKVMMVVRKYLQASPPNKAASNLQACNESS
ncbi:MAG: response regulator [Scytonematopsis contorta HA4267-MV1]|jgi:chemotaxis family two-component system response regulator PixG|nr:response regulator [Scytonematopsis contorta HA4267-MV1]